MDNPCTNMGQNTGKTRYLLVCDRHFHRITLESCKLIWASVHTIHPQYLQYFVTLFRTPWEQCRSSWTAIPLEPCRPECPRSPAAPLAWWCGPWSSPHNRSHRASRSKADKEGWKEAQIVKFTGFKKMRSGMKILFYQRLTEDVLCYIYINLYYIIFVTMRVDYVTTTRYVYAVISTVTYVKGTVWRDVRGLKISSSNP